MGEITSDAITHIRKSHNCCIMAYVDIIMLVSPENDDMRLFEAFSLFTELGFPMNPDKCARTARALTCLGIRIDFCSSFFVRRCCPRWLQKCCCHSTDKEIFLKMILKTIVLCLGPVSGLSFISKLMERVVATQVDMSLSMGWKTRINLPIDVAIQLKQLFCLYRIRFTYL